MKRPLEPLELSPDDARIAGRIQGDIPLSLHPFRDIADALGLTEVRVLETVRRLSDQGVIRKCVAIVRHQIAGYRGNALLLWAVPPHRLDEVGTRFARFREVTHCYERAPAFLGRYNLFTMVHLRRPPYGPLVERLSRAADVSDCLVLDSVEEYKKSSMEYFTS
jgi:DNA-binding Lrp family transcriptional regulator